MCLLIDNCDSFDSHVTKTKYKVNFAFNCDLSNVFFFLIVLGVDFATWVTLASPGVMGNTLTPRGLNVRQVET